MFGKTLLAGATAALLLSAAASAQTTSPAAPSTPSDQATQPLSSTTQSGTPYSDSGSGLPRDPSNMAPMNATRHGSDTAAQTTDKSETARIDRCKAMSHDAMMKDSGCLSLMRKHPTMMNGGPSPQ